MNRKDLESRLEAIREKQQDLTLQALQIEKALKEISRQEAQSFEDKVRELEKQEMAARFGARK